MAAAASNSNAPDFALVWAERARANAIAEVKRVAEENAYWAARNAEIAELRAWEVRLFKEFIAKQLAQGEEAIIRLGQFSYSRSEDYAGTGGTVVPYDDTADIARNQGRGSNTSTGGGISSFGGGTAAAAFTPQTADTPGGPITSAPTGLAKLLRDPQRLKDALEFVELLMDAEVAIVVPSSTRGKSSFVASGVNIIIPIPLKLSTPISDSTATAASVSTQLNLLLAALRITKQLPT